MSNIKINLRVLIVLLLVIFGCDGRRNEEKEPEVIDWLVIPDLPEHIDWKKDREAVDPGLQLIRLSEEGDSILQISSVSAMPFYQRLLWPEQEILVNTYKGSETESRLVRAKVGKHFWCFSISEESAVCQIMLNLKKGKGIAHVYPVDTNHEALTSKPKYLGGEIGIAEVFNEDEPGTPNTFGSFTFRGSIARDLGSALNSNVRLRHADPHAATISKKGEHYSCELSFIHHSQESFGAYCEMFFGFETGELFFRR